VWTKPATGWGGLETVVDFLGRRPNGSFDPTHRR
jgi:hypothetical protein